MKIFEKLEKIIKKEIPVCINEKNDIAHRIGIKQTVGEETSNKHHLGYEYFCFDCRDCSYKVKKNNHNYCTVNKYKLD